MRKVKNSMNVYVITCWDNENEPIVTVFDNSVAAQTCYDNFLGKYKNVCIDDCPVYSRFTVSE